MTLPRWQSHSQNWLNIIKEMTVEARDRVTGLSDLHLASNWAPAAHLRQRPSATKKFVTKLSRLIWTFLISFYFYPTLIHLCLSCCTSSSHQTTSLYPLHLCPPPSCMPQTNALPICLYQTSCYHPSPFKNHWLHFHFLLLLRSPRYILPTCIY